MGMTLVGREAELAAVERFTERVQTGPAALLLEGEAGIGKTTLWRAGCEAAQHDGQRVLVAVAVETEAKLGYAALAELLSTADDEAIRTLPVPQREALEAALLRASPPSGSPPDARSVATAVLSLLEQAAEEQPVVLAIDDLQWLDASTAQAIRFVSRRLTGRVGILTTSRLSESESMADALSLREADRLTCLRLEPLEPAAVHGLLRARLGRAFAQPLLQRIESVAAGNPFLALEVARSLEADAHPASAKLPASVREIVDERLAGLAPAVRETLLVAAAMTRPCVGWIQSATEGTGAAELLVQAEAAGVIELEGGRVRFTHPLLASGIYAAASATKRRAAHERLSEVVEGVEERARHLALASLVVDPEVLGGTGRGSGRGQRSRRTRRCRGAGRARAAVR